MKITELSQEKQKTQDVQDNLRKLKIQQEEQSEDDK
jgi:hypothetical protein